MVVVTNPPKYPNDRVIGFYSYAYFLKNPIFKQDFIVDVGKKDNKFVLYSRQNLTPKNEYIKDLHDFFITYGKEGNYLHKHHLTIQDIPKEANFRATEAINLANRIQPYVFQPLDKQSLIKANKDLQNLKLNNKLNPVWKKLKDYHN